jgi:hypothetical protein
MEDQKDEPTIKVSELREWCEVNLGSLEDEPTLDYSDGYNYALEEILSKFCKEAD